MCLHPPFNALKTGANEGKGTPDPKVDMSGGLSNEAEDLEFLGSFS